ncbi:MAG: VOC family protein [Hyphomicrobium sp.]|uniref:VOC family protein n=1 Tax=Hyphomicrobium sp. TaxID=82 RepID=UPI00132B53EB|nr:VOC family protein [Hyphomicrobium sp.]KAB2943457.1 MAG: VOC family protein [Hyphomicrobium sp.]MBZ0210695.1 VOC family protein [Hyphomicrobium sp.]
MQPRLSLITLGVADLARARAFYEALGFKAGRASNDNVTFFPAGGVVLALFGRGALAEDATVADTPTGSAGTARGFAGIALAHNARSEADVDAALAEAVAAGGKLIKPAGKTFWGGYAGYFADPDGHLWEVAHNPYFTLDDGGRVVLDM